MEKLCPSLYYACNKLHHYMLLTMVHVIGETDVIKYMLTQPIVRGCIAKWAFALSEINLVYVPLRTVKGQAVADFITKYPCVHIEEDNDIDSVF